MCNPTPEKHIKHSFQKKKKKKFPNKLGIIIFGEK